MKLFQAYVVIRIEHDDDRKWEMVDFLRVWLEDPAKGVYLLSDLCGQSSYLIPQCLLREFCEEFDVVAQDGSSRETVVNVDVQAPRPLALKAK